MDKITHEVRLARWTRLVEQCQSRPEGQTIAQWCKEAAIASKHQGSTARPFHSGAAGVLANAEKVRLPQR